MNIMSKETGIFNFKIAGPAQVLLSILPTVNREYDVAPFETLGALPERGAVIKASWFPRPSDLSTNIFPESYRSAAI